VIETPLFSEIQWIKVLESISGIDFKGFSTKNVSRVLETVAIACEMETRAVRQAAVDCITSICGSIPADAVEIVLPPLLTTMSESQDLATVRACSLLIFSQTIHLLVPATKSTLFSSLRRLESDLAVIVRHSFAVAARRIIRFLKGTFATNLLSVMREFATDRSFTVCCEVAKFLIDYVDVSSQVDKALEVGSLLLNCSNWRVRCSYVNLLSQIYSGQKVEFEVIFEILKAAAGDPDDEVKTAAAEQLPFLTQLENLESESISALFESLFQSDCAHVRTSIAKYLPEFTPHLSADFIAKSLLELSKDQAQAVKITAIESLRSPKIPISTKIQCISESMKGSQWREKYSLTKLIPQIYIVSEGESFGGLVEELLFDEACDVRKSMVEELSYLMERSEGRLKESVLKLAKEKMNGDDYQLRQTAVLVAIKGEMLDEDDGVEILRMGIKDPVANVRLTLALNLPRRSELLWVVEALKEDSDEDIRDACMI
jgi:hypothetical protein